MTSLQFKLDPTGFPMIWIDVINAYMHWMPVTKIQFEYFLCATSDNLFDANWYDTILKLNPRVTPSGIRDNNYWNAFLTGIKPEEAQRFARWYGEGYTLPTLDDWFKAYQALKGMSPEPPDVFNNMGNLQHRARTLLIELDNISSRISQQLNHEPTLMYQMLMCMGVMEWVECRDQRWGGMGQTIRKFRGGFFTPDRGQPSLPNNPNIERLYYYGFRLIWRPR